MKKIVAGKGLQHKLLFEKKNKLLPVARKKELLRIMSLLELFFLTTFVFFQLKVLLDIRWGKHK